MPEYAKTVENTIMGNGIGDFYGILRAIEEVPGAIYGDTNAVATVIVHRAT